MGRTKNKKDYHKMSLSVQSLNQWKYHLSESTLLRGVNYPQYNDTWDCGPNSAGRALHMWNKINIDFSNYEEFKSNCPKLIGWPQTTGGSVAFCFINVLTLGLSSIVTKALDAKCSVGPSPGELAGYITDSLQGVGKGINSGSRYFDQALDEIKIDLEAGNPVIALIAWGSFRMHYVNIVALSDQDDVAILDTNNDLYYYNRSDFQDLFDCSSYIPHNLILSNYNLIRFEKF